MTGASVLRVVALPGLLWLARAAAARAPLQLHFRRAAGEALTGRMNRAPGAG